MFPTLRNPSCLGVTHVLVILWTVKLSPKPPLAHTDVLDRWVTRRDFFKGLTVTVVTDPSVHVSQRGCSSRQVSDGVLTPLVEGEDGRGTLRYKEPSVRDVLRTTEEKVVVSKKDTQGVIQYSE